MVVHVVANLVESRMLLGGMAQDLKTMGQQVAIPISKKRVVEMAQKQRLKVHRKAVSILFRGL